MTLVHATCVAIGDHAVLLTGSSGAGKSDLALRLIDRGAVLVSDDQVRLSAIDGRLWGEAPATIAGRMEVRGLGIVETTYLSPMPIALAVELVQEVERMPEPRTRILCGLPVPLVALAAFEASAAIKVEWALDDIRSLSKKSVHPERSRGTHVLYAQGSVRPSTSLGMDDISHCLTDD